MEVRRLKDDELQHYGVLGMKWGVRRYQNKDGSLTAEGKAKLNKYKTVQRSLVVNDQQMLNAQKEKILNKHTKKVTKFEKKGNDKKVKEIKEKFAKDKNIKRIDTQLENKRKELAVIEKMKFEDMKSEKVAKYAALAKRSLADGLAIGVMSMLVSFDTAVLITPTVFSGNRAMRKSVSKYRLKQYDKKFNNKKV